MIDEKQLEDVVVNSAPGTITVWSDVGCPWAMLALHTLRDVARSRCQEILIDHRAFPLELFNRSPSPKTLVDAELVVIGGKVPELGLQLWNAADYTYPATTLPAMEAVQAAKAEEVGGLRASDELDEALRRAYFTDSRCVSLHSVILDVAGDCRHVDAEALGHALSVGKGRVEVYRDWRVAQGPGVQGSPHLFSAAGNALHNPGVSYTWTARPPIGSPWSGRHGFPILDSYSRDWAPELLDSLTV